MERRRILVLVAALVLAAPACPAPARADCIDDCQRGFNCFSVGTDYNICESQLQECYRRECNKPKVAYGAIAYGPQSTANGYAFDKASSQDADQTALRFCRQHGNDCKVVASFSNSCAAVAAVESKGAYAVGLGGTRDGAQSKAMGACAGQHGAGCEIEVWSCAKP